MFWISFFALGFFFYVIAVIKADQEQEELVKRNVHTSFMLLLHQSHQDLYQIFEICAKSTKMHMENLFSCNLSFNYPVPSFFNVLRCSV